MGWPDRLLTSFFQGFEDGDGSQDVGRVSLWTSSDRLAGDLLTLGSRLGRRAAAYLRIRHGREHFQVGFPKREHKLLTTIPLPDRLLSAMRASMGLTLKAAAHRIGFKNSTDLCNIEMRSGRDAIRRTTAARIAVGYADFPDKDMLNRLERLAWGDLAWDRVVDVVRCAEEPIFDIGVRPDGAKIENFLAGRGGVFVSNTAGFVDPGFRGHLTLEFSNVANLPITLYPGMKIGQMSLFRTSSPVENLYGSGELGSKYLDQEGPTPSRYWENFNSE
jgi:dCTP deaminase